MSYRLEAEVVYGVRISYDQKEILEEKFAEAGRYMWPVDYECEEWVLGYCLADGIEDSTVEVQSIMNIPMQAQVTIIAMLQELFEIAPEFKIYLVCHWS